MAALPPLVRVLHERASPSVRSFPRPGTGEEHYRKAEVMIKLVLRHLSIPTGPFGDSFARALPAFRRPHVSARLSAQVGCHASRSIRPKICRKSVDVK